MTFVMERDGDVSAFDSIERAAIEVEGYDVNAGEYTLFCTVDGERLHPRLLDHVRVELLRTGEQALDQLIELLRKHAARNHIDSDPSDPEAVARELLRRLPPGRHRRI